MVWIGDGRPGRHPQAKKPIGDQPWPFETGQWPPAYVPAELQTEIAAPPEMPEARQQVAYTDVSQSADQISAPAHPPRTR